MRLASNDLKVFKLNFDLNSGIQKHLNLNLFWIALDIRLKFEYFGLIIESIRAEYQSLHWIAVKIDQLQLIINQNY